jgi:hypothetical protein
MSDRQKEIDKLKKQKRKSSALEKKASQTKKRSWKTEEEIGAQRSKENYDRSELIRKKFIESLVKKTGKPISFQELIKKLVKLQKEMGELDEMKLFIALLQILKDDTKYIDYKTRILKNLITRGLVQPSCSASKRRKKRRFKGHAKRWQYGMKGKSVGEMIQIDHMTVTKNKVSGKHFQAWDPASRFIYANLYGNAKSKTAKKFLLDLRKKVPFSISSIQVDGGSEFMKEFEMACQELKIPLYVLPPKRPQYNGGVERGNRSFREEFYSQQNLLADSMQSLRYGLSKAVTKYNTYRPHFSLKGLTPMEYIRANYQRSELSHS